MTENTENNAESPSRVIVAAGRGAKHAFDAGSFDVDPHGYLRVDAGRTVATFAPSAWTIAELEGNRAEPDADRYRRAYQAAARGLDLVRAALRADDPDLADALAEADKASETAWCIAEDEL